MGYYLTLSLAEHVASLLRRAGLKPSNGLAEALVKLIELNKSRAVSSFHAILQYVVAMTLYKEGYDVWVEYDVGGGLTADVYAESPRGTVIVEVETGYVPPAYLSSPVEFLEARVAFKAILYSGRADIFVIATPSHIVLPRPRGLGSRAVLVDRERLARLLELTHGKPFEWAMEELPRARVDGFVKIIVDEVSVEPRPSLWWSLFHPDKYGGSLTG